MEMQIVGRLTKNAKVSATKSGKEVINFDVAVNEKYKVKATGELKSATKFVQCSMWRATSLAKYLTKGKLVQLTGDVGANAYVNKDGKAIGVLTLKVIKLTFLEKSGEKQSTQTAAAEAVGTTVDDLPF
jgi:single-strand DNA-binding protein